MQKRRRVLGAVSLIAILTMLFSMTAFAAGGEATQPAMYGTYWSLIPPLVAIVLALITKEVYSSLFVGILIGGLFYSGFQFELTVNHVFQDRFRVMELLLSPLLSAVRATPVTSFIVLALVWLSSPRVPILTGFLMTLPVVYSALVQAIRAIDPNLLEMAQMYGFGRAKTLVHVIIPAVLPAFLQSCLAAIGLCWKAVVAAEVIGVPKPAVGSKLYEAKIYLETDSLLAWTLTIVLLSVLLEALLKKAAKRLMEVRHG